MKTKYVSDNVCYCYCYFYLVSYFIPSRNLESVLFYNHIAIMSLRNRSHVKVYMFKQITNYIFIHTYIRSLLNIILIHILKAWTRLEPVPYCLCI